MKNFGEYAMDKQTIVRAVEEIKNELSAGNKFGEKVILVAATKMQTAEAINAAIEAGVDAVAENKAQEFRDKNEYVLPCPRHFIGHLQTNKLKYLVGKVELFHSCDRDELALEIAKLSLKRGVTFQDRRLAHQRLYGNAARQPRRSIASRTYASNARFV